MTERTYPFTVWVLGGTFIPRQVELVKPSGYQGTHRAENGKYLHDSECFETKEAAIQHGHERLKDQEEKINKRLQVIAKKRANLEKHA